MVAPSSCDTERVANRRPSRWLFAALTGWAVFGSWALFRPEVDRVLGLDTIVGHVVVFFFVALPTFALLVRWMGFVRGLTVGLVVSVAVAGLSEWLQPILTETRQAQLADFAGDAVGIVAALVVTAILHPLIRSERRRERVVAMCCAIGLIGSAGLIVADTDPVRAWRECGGVGYEPIVDVASAPVIHVDGDEVQFADGVRRPLGDGVIAADSAALRCSVLADGAYTIVATVTPESIEMEGTPPKRIFTSSVGINFDEYNTHIGQDFDELSVRIRSGSSRQWESIPSVFEAGREVTVAVVVSDGRAEVFVDGASRAEFELEGSSLAEWDESYPILIGDEFTGNRTFVGDIATVSFFDRALDAGDPALTPAR